MPDLTGVPLSLLRPQPAAPAAGANRPVPDDIRRVAEEFEAVFLAEMLSPMFDSLDTEGLGGGGIGEQMFRPMLVERYAEAIAKGGGIGIADSVVREFMRMQSVINPEDADGAIG